MKVVERLLDDAVELIAEDPADDEAAEEEHQRADDALAQFLQVLHQTHAGQFGTVRDGFAGPVHGIEISHGGSRFRTRNSLAGKRAD